MATTKNTTRPAASTESVKQITYLAAALKAPRITEAAARLADQARDAGWTHEDYLAAVLEREVSANPRAAISAATWCTAGSFSATPVCALNRLARAVVRATRSGSAIAASYCVASSPAPGSRRPRAPEPSSSPARRLPGRRGAPTVIAAIALWARPADGAQ